MANAISFREFAIIIQSIKDRSEKYANGFLEDCHIKKAVYISETYGINIKQALEMFFYTKYRLEISVSFNIYGDKDGFYVKKPNFFKRIFKKYTVSNVTVFHDKVFINNKQLDDYEAGNFRMIF